MEETTGQGSGALHRRQPSSRACLLPRWFLRSRSQLKACLSVEEALWEPRRSRLSAKVTPADGLLHGASPRNSSRDHACAPSSGRSMRIRSANGSLARCGCCGAGSGQSRGCPLRIDHRGPSKGYAFESEALGEGRRPHASSLRPIPRSRLRLAAAYLVVIGGDPLWRGRYGSFGLFEPRQNCVWPSESEV